MKIQTIANLADFIAAFPEANLDGMLIEELQGQKAYIVGTDLSGVIHASTVHHFTPGKLSEAQFIIQPGSRNWTLVRLDQPGSHWEDYEEFQERECEREALRGEGREIPDHLDEKKRLRLVSR